jgi:proteasome component ECM29
LKLHGDSQLLRLINSKFLRIAISRTTLQDELETLLRDGILKDISASLSSTGAIGSYLFHFLLHILMKYDLPRRGTPRHSELRSVLGIGEKDGDSLSQYLGRFLLLTSPAVSFPDSGSFAGISTEDLGFYLVPELQNTWDPEKPFGLSLAKAKARVLDFAETPALTPSEQLWIFMFAVPETNGSAVSDRGSSHFKALQPKDPEDEQFIVRLLTLYRGGIQRKTPLPPISLRTRVLSLLSKSKVTIRKQSVLMNYLLEEGLADETGGLTSKRFNTEYVSFMVHYLRLQHEGSLSKEVAYLFVEKIVEFITQLQGWPTANPGSDLRLRGSLYQLIGTAVKEGRLLDPRILIFLLASLNGDNAGNDIQLSVEEALSSVTVAFSVTPLEPEMQTVIEDILNIGNGREKLHRSCFYITTRLANRCLPYSSSVARYINIRVSGSKEGTFEAAEEARKGLDPNWFKATNSYRPDLWKKDGTASVGSESVSDFKFPSFHKTMEMFFPEEDLISDEITAPDVLDLAKNVRKLSIENPEVFSTMIQYTFRLLIVEALDPSELPKIDEQWERSVSVILSSSPRSRNTLKTHLT